MVTADGQKFGPADVNTLQQWANEGRLLATSMLEEEISGNRVQAGAVPGLNLGGGQASPYAQASGYQAPQSNPYQQQSPYGQPQSPYGQSQAPYGQPVDQSGQNNPYSQNPYAGGGYYRGAGGNPAYDPNLQKEMSNAWIGGALGLVCCAPFAIWGLTCANRAKAGGHPSATGAIALNIVALVLWGIGILLNVGIFALAGA